MITPAQIKGTIALFVLTAWALLYGVSFSEAVESFQNTIEPPDENIEQALSLDVGQNTDITPIAPKFIGLPNVGEVNNLRTPIRPPDSAACQYHTTQCGPKLFKLLSIYRL
jgi:hypothetical protein